MSKQNDDETTTEDPTLPPPADFDLDAWFGGVRSTIRSCTIYQRGDVLAEIEEAERRLQLATADDAEEYGIEDAGSPDALNERIEDLYQVLLDSGVTFRVEARSSDWLADVEKEWKRHRDTNGMNDQEKLAVVHHHQLAGSILEPAGVTAEHLARLEATSGAQYRKLLGTFFAACSQAPTVTAPTSPSSSARRGGRGR